jgi:alpha-1,2-mannosyltransferase
MSKAEVPRSVTRQLTRGPSTYFALAMIPTALLIALFARWLYGDYAHWMSDLDVYRSGGAAIRSGASLYDFVTSQRLPFTYSPFAGLLFVPLSFLTLNQLAYVWQGLCLWCLSLVAWRTLREVGVDSCRMRACLAFIITVASVWIMPFKAELQLGQINTLLMLLALVDLTSRRPNKMQGVLVGLTAGVKLIPLIFIVYLLITRRTRVAATVLVTFLATVIVGFIFLPKDSTRYWFSLFYDADRVGPAQPTYNQSLRAVLARLADTPNVTFVWLGAAAIVGALGLLAASLAHRTGDGVLGVLLCALTGLLVSPVSWEMHWVWIIPFLVVVVYRALRARKAVWIVLGAGLTVVYYLPLYYWDMPNKHFDGKHLDVIQQLLGASFVLPALAVLVVSLAFFAKRFAALRAADRSVWEPGAGEPELTTRAQH